jgi:hypothetical protein
LAPDNLRTGVVRSGEWYNPQLNQIKKWLSIMELQLLQHGSRNQGKPIWKAQLVVYAQVTAAYKYELASSLHCSERQRTKSKLQECHKYTLL